MSAHRADAYCAECGGACRDQATIDALTHKPLSLRPMFTGAGGPSFKPARKAGRFDA